MGRDTVTGLGSSIPSQRVRIEVMQHADYPFSSNRRGCNFLDALSVSQAGKVKITHANADRLLGLKG